MNLNQAIFRRFLSLLAALAVLAAACGDDDDTTASGADDAPTTVDDGADDDTDESEESDDATVDAGYEYASNVESHRLVSLDTCEINELLDADEIDFDAISTIYRDGGNSVKDDGSVRTIGGFAADGEKSPLLTEYYGTEAPLDEFVTAALEGADDFDGATDSARKQGVQKGIQNQIMIAWVLNELDAALAKAADGNFDVDDGAVHNWDEAWAFYAGAETDCSPYATATKRAENFGTLAADGETAAANEAILDAMLAGRDALLAEDLDTAVSMRAEVERNIVVTYAQAVIRYSTVLVDDLAAGDEDSAATHRAEGYSFWRVIEATAVANGANADVINALLAPDGQGGGDEVRASLQPALDALGISDADIGVLS